jgi:hypothetical protein
LSVREQLLLLPRSVIGVNRVERDLFLFASKASFRLREHRLGL